MVQSTPRLPVLSTIEYVVSRSTSVLLHRDRIGPAVETWGHLLKPAAPQSWEHPCHFFDGTAETVRWIFTLDILNHCFWPDPGEPVWTVAWRGQPWSGYWGLAASLKRGLESGAPVTDPLWLSRISLEEVEGIFAGDGRIPMMEERLANLREAGSVILDRFDGDIQSLFESANGSAVRLVMEVASHFPSFRDEAFYRGQTVYFWKRAQILASDVFSAFGGEKWGTFSDIDNLTAFADYKLPQVLRELGIISYHPELAAAVDSLRYLPPGSEQEVEIRAMTIHAVEEIKGAFARSGRPATSPEVDNWLWQLGQLDAFRKRPYHRCRTIYY